MLSRINTLELLFVLSDSVADNRLFKGILLVFLLGSSAVIGAVRLADTVGDGADCVDAGEDAADDVAWS